CAIDVFQRSEFVGLLQLDVAPACVQRAGGDRGVTLFERRRDRAWNNAISCDAILRVEKLHLLFQQTDVTRDTSGVPLTARSMRSVKSSSSRYEYFAPAFSRSVSRTRAPGAMVIGSQTSG